MLYDSDIGLRIFLSANEKGQCTSRFYATVLITANAPVRNDPPDFHKERPECEKGGIDCHAEPRPIPFWRFAPILLLGHNNPYPQILVRAHTSGYPSVVL